MDFEKAAFNPTPKASGPASLLLGPAKSHGSHAFLETTMCSQERQDKAVRVREMAWFHFAEKLRICGRPVSVQL